MKRPVDRSLVVSGALGPLPRVVACACLLAQGAVAEHIDPMPAPEGLTEMDYYALEVLTKAQHLGFVWGVEVCGMIGRRAGGELVHTHFTRGGPDTCTIPDPDEMEPLASFHTHGVPEELSDGEVPSDTDLLSDFDDGLYGYVSTPNGRFWKVRPDHEDTVMLCHGCVPANRNYRPCGDTIKSRYTLKSLDVRFNRPYEPCP